MTPLISVFGAIFLALALLWPLSFFGYKFYSDLIHKEEEKHAARGGH